MDKLGDTLRELQNKITNNGIYANRVVNESVNIMKNAEKANTDFNDLQDKYQRATNELSEKLKKPQFSKKNQMNCLVWLEILL